MIYKDGFLQFIDVFEKKEQIQYVVEMETKQR